MLKKLINPTIEDMLQLAVHEELYASNFYKHLSVQCQRIGLFGAAKYFASESMEELEHYQCLAEYLNDRGTVAEIPSIMGMDETITGLAMALSLAYGLEVDLGNKYSKWYQAASTDPVTQQFLLKYIEIQRNSVGDYGDLLVRTDLAGDNMAAVLLIDQELGA